MIPRMVSNVGLMRMNARSHWKAWDAFAASNPAVQRETLSRRMLETLQYFGQRGDGLNEWRELADGASPEVVWNNWESLPVITKADLHERFNPDETIEKYGVRGAVNTTGGSTGVPARFVWDDQAQSQKGALAKYCWWKMGWQPGMPMGSLWGSPRDVGQSDTFRTRLNRRLSDFTMIDGFEFSDQTVEEFRQLVSSKSGLAVYGYSTLLERMAGEFLARSIEVPEGAVKTAWNGAEPVYDHQSDLFEQVFGTPIHNLYGGREMGAMAYKLAKESSFVILRPVILLEILNEQNKLCRPGEVGRVVLTTLIGRGTPFIRYEIGDLARYEEGDLTESGLQGMSQLEGRLSAMIHLPEGRTLHSAFFVHLLKDYRNIRGFHVHQSQDGSIEIMYVGEQFTEEVSESVRSHVTRILGTAELTISRVNELPKTSQGKNLQVTSDYTPTRQ